MWERIFYHLSIYYDKKMERYEEREDIDSDTLMQLPDNKLSIMKERKLLDAPSVGKEKTLALQAKVEKPKKQKRKSNNQQKIKDKKHASTRKESERTNKKQHQEKPTWIPQQPDEIDLYKPRK